MPSNILYHKLIELYNILEKYFIMCPNVFSLYS